MDAPVEPPACVGAFSSEAGGLHYSCAGEETTTIGVYDVQTEQWTLNPTTGPPPPGLRGGCAIVTNELYCFGGYNSNRSSLINDLHKLNLRTYQWSKVQRNGSSEQPICKTGCGLVAVNERTLACFGGYGSEPAHVQPGSTFTTDIDSSGQTNEFHLFNIQEGISLYHHSLFSVHVCTVYHYQLITIQSLLC